jgi:hypothetical protein
MATTARWPNYCTGFGVGRGQNNVEGTDNILMLHRPELYDPGQHEGMVEVIIAKQRNGPTGEITLTFIKQFMRFENFVTNFPYEEESF